MNPLSVLRRSALSHTPLIRHFSKIAVASICVSFAAFSQLSVADQNVLIVIADDLGKDSIGLYETQNQTAPTPNIDALAKNGVTFTNAWANPVCSPTRATLLSGQYGFRNGVTTVVGGRSGGDGIDTSTYTLFNALAESNVGVVGNSVIGKWHLNDDSNGDTDNPNIMGVDYFAGLATGRFDYFNWEKTVNGVTQPVSNYSVTENVDDSIAWISEQDGPWLNWLAFMSPHSPFHKPPSDLHSYDDLVDDNAAARENPIPYYQAMIEAMDTELGRLLAYLKQIGEYDNTTIIFLGDNGTPEQVVAQPYDPEKAKGSLYQGGVNVPLVIGGAGVANKGRTTNALANAVDIFSTTLAQFGIEAADLPANVVIDSKSLVPVMQGNAGTREFVYSEIKGLSSTPDGQAISNGRYKLISYAELDEELYNLRSDPLETNNLIASGLSSEDQSQLALLREGFNTLGAPYYKGGQVPTPTAAPTAAPTSAPSPTPTRRRWRQFRQP